MKFETTEINRIKIDRLISKLKVQFDNESTGHDWFHIERVWKNAKQIALSENSDCLIVELGALLHDIADHKFVENADEEVVVRIYKLLSPDFEPEMIERVIYVVNACSFKGGFNPLKDSMTIEAMIVQDADRLDAIGAIGIARTFAYGGKFGNEIYNPNIKPTQFNSAEEYKKSRTHTINHFYEKLLLLKDKMNTETGKRLAEQRHDFMKGYLQQFYDEWNGNK